MVKVTGLHGLGDDTVENGDVNIDYPDTPELYIMGSFIGVKSFRKLCFSVEANGWLKSADKFINAKTRRISRLVRVLGIDSLEKIFGYQATLAMMRPLRDQQNFLARLKKSGRNYWRRPNNSNMK